MQIHSVDGAKHYCVECKKTWLTFHLTRSQPKSLACSFDVGGFAVCPHVFWGLTHLQIS